MSDKKRPLSEEEEQLLGEAMDGVRPLNNDRRAPHLNPPPPRILPHHEEETNPLADPISDAYQADYEVGGGFSRPGLQKRLLKRLQKGALPVRAMLDLHGYPIHLAREELLLFLQSCRGPRQSCVLVVTGKGHHSKPHQRTLRQTVPTWLIQLDEVLAFQPARQQHGGEGALYVLLRAERP